MNNTKCQLNNMNNLKIYYKIIFMVDFIKINIIYIHSKIFLKYFKILKSERKYRNQYLIYSILVYFMFYTNISLFKYQTYILKYMFDI